MTAKLKAVDGCSSHHLQGAGHIVAAAIPAAQLAWLRKTVIDYVVWRYEIDTRRH